MKPHADNARSETERRTLEELGWRELLSELARRCHSERARAAAEDLPLLQRREPLEALLAQVVELRDLHHRREAPPFGEVHDLRPALKRLDKEGVLGGTTLIAVADTLRSLDKLARFLRGRGDQAPRVAALAGRLQDTETVWGAITDCFGPDGELYDNASSELYDLRRRVSDLHRQLTKQMKRLMDSPHIGKHLQDRFFTEREQRFVLPVRSDAGGQVEGIVHGSSSSGATIFVEPREVVGLNNQLKVSQMAVHREEARIMGQLSTLVAEESAAIASNLELGLELDLLDARARLAVDLDATCPRLSEEGELTLRAARHPLLALSGIEVVPNDIILGAGKGLLISGPNAGGKTVCLKTAGLCALMVRAGLLLPVAPDSCIPLYRRVLAEIGDAQSLAQNLSTFTAHLAQLLGFFQLLDDDAMGAAERWAARKVTGQEAQRQDDCVGALVLIDEIVTGTDPRQGEALARALLEELVDRSAQLLVTTHYEGLKALPTKDERFVNANVGFDLDAMLPTFTLHIGTPGTSFALAVARKLGLEERVAGRAEALMADAEQELSALLAELADERSKLLMEQREARQAKSRAADLERRHERRLAELKERGQQALGRSHGEALAELKGARVELTRARKALRDQRKLDDERLRQLDRQVSTAARSIVSHEPKPVPPETRPLAVEDLEPGREVYVPRLGGRAEVLSTPRKGRIEVRFGTMRTLVSVDELELPKHAEKRKATRQAPDPRLAGPKVVPTSGRTVDNTLDLRGQRVDDALREVDNFLDQALLEGRDVVYVLHGRGTGALRSAIREAAARSPVVADMHEADREAGGDAVTVLELR